jgi:hypothetical protein
MNDEPVILKYFNYSHLPPHLQAPSRLFAALVVDIVRNIPDNEERGVALRKLLEAKDAAVRAMLGAPTSFNWESGQEPGLGNHTIDDD